MYTPHTERDITQMLAVIGAGSLDELCAVPAEVALRTAPEMSPALPEIALSAKMAGLAARNTGAAFSSFAGAGAYRHYIPPAIVALAMRGEFLTAYTPYQAEVSQGYLQAIYEWQTYIALLTGLEVANASVYDGATATAEAVIMAVNATGRRAVLISAAVHPNYRAVVRTSADGLDLGVDELPYDTQLGTTAFGAIGAALAQRQYAAVIVQNPNFFGAVDFPDGGDAALIKAHGALLIAVTAEALALAALPPPGAWGADIAVGEAQSFGVPVAYGGPYAGFVATSSEHVRRIPGRLVGKSLDNRGNPAYVLTLQAREQHIRRERATSNICTNQAHCALLATMYLAALGKTGLRDCAAENLRLARELAAGVTARSGFTQRFSAPYFNELVIKVPGPAARLLDRLAQRNILGGVDLGRWYPELADCVLMNATELTTPGEIAALSATLGELVVHEAARA